MIPIQKDHNDVPKVLNDKWRREAFQQNVVAGEYVCNDIYKPESVYKKLVEDIYHFKCGYCEKSVIDFPKHVEHYRPKRKNPQTTKADGSFGYYWLCFSWDNLLIACDNCNTSKGSCFDIAGTRLNYQKQALKDLHADSRNNAQTEKPLLIHPELEDVQNKICFSREGKMLSKDQRVRYTIRICNLNRPELVEKRKNILDDFLSRLELSFNIWKKDVDRINYFENPIETFKNKLNNPRTEFILWRKFILKNYLQVLSKPGESDFNLALELAFLTYIN